MVKLSNKDAKFREQVLSGPIWPTVWKVCIPLAIFQTLTNAFNILDTLMASSISSDAVSTVVYFVQLNHIVSSIGSGLAVGGSILISRRYGAGSYEEVKRILSTVVAIAFMIGTIVLLMIPFVPAILRATGTPETFINLGSSYFALTLSATVINFFNLIYISIERARGNSKSILKLNTLIIIVKLSLTAIFVYLLDGGILMIALATMISYLVLFCIAIKNLTRSDDAFSFSFKFISLKKKVWLPILKLSLPSMAEKIAFSYGKAIINTMAASYGTNAVGASGISNNMSGLLTGIQMGFQDGGTSLQGQIHGAGKLERAVQFYRRIILIQVIIGVLGVIFYQFLKFPVAKLFSMTRGGFDPVFQKMIIDIFSFEIIGCLLLSLSYAAMTVILGMGKTKLVLLINFCRLFVFRIPIMYMLSNFTDIGYKAVGMTVATSNAAVGIMSFVIAEIVIAKERKKQRANIVLESHHD